jgi:hypothetical protein
VVGDTVTDPLQYDERIKKGCVIVDDHGFLYIAMGKFFRKSDGTPNAWYGVGFNGEQILCELPQFVAPNINVYILLTYGDA